MMEGQTTDNQTSQGLTTSQTGTTGAEPAADSLSGALDSVLSGGTKTALEGRADKSAETDKGTGKTKTEEKTDKKDEPVKLEAWGDQLSDEIKNDPACVKSLSKFKKVSDLAKSYTELEAKLGSAVTIPGDSASDEEKAAFMRKLGMPETADGYKCTSNLEGDGKSFINGMLYDVGMTEKQAEKFVSSFQKINEINMRMLAANRKEMIQKTEGELKKEYGNDFKANMGYYQKGLSSAGKDVVAALDRAGVSMDKAVVDYFVRAGKYASEGKSPAKTDGTPSQRKSIAEGGTFSYNS
jgi:hypothetical protein